MRQSRFLGKKRYIILFILGAMVFLYPAFSNLYYKYIIIKSQVLKTPAQTPLSKESDNIDVKVSDKEFEEIESDPVMNPLLDKGISYLRAYNKRLSNAAGDKTDPFGNDEGGAIKLEITEGTDGASVFAYIRIDKINQTLPVYLGATDEHLKKGVAVIQGTSIPVGGENTNSVIAGHTGLVKRFFTDLPKLKPGDEIEITNRFETLYYKVTGNKLIWPDQSEYLASVAGKDMITLLTCYHGTSVNDRLLVFAERYFPERKSEVQKEEKPTAPNTEERATENKEIEKKETDSYDYLIGVELEEKSWYEKTQTYASVAAVILICIFLYTYFGKKNN
jgi:sortase A